MILKDAGYLRNVLRRQLGLVAVTALVVARRSLGSGSFSPPPAWLRSARSPFWL